MYYISSANFDIFPKVVKANQKSKIEIVCQGDEAKFKQDITYLVTVSPLDFEVDNGEIYSFTINPTNGKIEFEYEFKGEQEWKVNVRPTPNPERMSLGFGIYSVYEDLYERNPYAGDFHTHSIRQDGSEEPVVLLGEYRKKGYDCFALTEHNMMAASLEAIENSKDIPTNMKVFRGEEVHLRGGYLHIIDLFSKQGINELYWSNPDKYHEDIVEMTKTLDIPDGINKLDYCYRKWISDRIHENGGLCVLAHAFWRVKETGKNGGNTEYHMRYKMIEYCIKTGIYDAVEYAHGAISFINDIMRSRYEEIFVKTGKRLPIVGSSDTHCPNPERYFIPTHSICFAKELSMDGIKESILNKYTVVITKFATSNVDGVNLQKTRYTSHNIHGPHRIVKFADFLMRNYFPHHDELCLEEGEQILRFIDKKKNAKEILEIINKRVDNYRDKCFGR